MKRAFVENGAELSRWANRTLFGGCNETVSSRLGKLERRKIRWARAVCLLIALVLWDRNHCREAIETPL